PSVRGGPSPWTASRRTGELRLPRRRAPPARGLVGRRGGRTDVAPAPQPGRPGRDQSGIFDFTQAPDWVRSLLDQPPVSRALGLSAEHASALSFSAQLAQPMWFVSR